MAGGLQRALPAAQPSNPNAARTAPSYYLPSVQGGPSGVRNPQYEQQKADYDAQQRAAQTYDTERQNLFTNAASGSPVSQSFTDPRTGMTYEYGGAGSRLNSRAGGGGDLNLEQAKIQAEMMLPPAPAPAVLPPRVAAPVRADNSTAESATFARAKDRIGMTGQGAMKSLASQMSRRGLAGSGIEGAQIGELLGGVRGQLGDVVRDQTIEGLKRDYAVEDRNYAGDLNQRGQDIGYGTTTRGQDIGAAQSRASLMPTLLQLLMRSGTGAAY